MRTCSPNASNNGKTTTTTIDPAAPFRGKHRTNDSSNQHETRCHKPLSVAQRLRVSQNSTPLDASGELGFTTGRFADPPTKAENRTLTNLAWSTPLRNGLGVHTENTTTQAPPNRARTPYATGGITTAGYSDDYSAPRVLSRIR